ncbi:cytochrome P450 [Ochromonadaceae sp. CCMP2298]|nr:cytochrome P450 [Ochromonadaceae sp. CCMP2298]|mmetsp:Transcript_19505/g.42317  ORF Transcript_19505/g.42317 Transcript_19505/m.42317 type:complete len:788 (+) Transcript_19505:105-2468(+)
MFDEVLANSLILTVLFCSVLLGFGVTLLTLHASDSRTFDTQGKYIPGPVSSLWGRNFNTVLAEARKNKLVSRTIWRVLLNELGNGDIVGSTSLGHQTVVVAHPDMVKAVLSGHHLKFAKTSQCHRLKFFLGEGLLTSAGARWEDHRHLINPSFHADSVKSMIPNFNKQSQRLVKHWLSNIRRLMKVQPDAYSISVNLKADLHHLTMSVICSSAFSYDFQRAQDRDLMAAALEAISAELNQRTVDPTHWWHWLFPQRRGSLHAALGYFWPFLEGVVDQRLAEYTLNLHKGVAARQQKEKEKGVEMGKEKEAEKDKGRGKGGKDSDLYEKPSLLSMLRPNGKEGKIPGAEPEAKSAGSVGSYAFSPCGRAAQDFDNVSIDGLKSAINQLRQSQSRDDESERLFPALRAEGNRDRASSFTSLSSVESGGERDRADKDEGGRGLGQDRDGQSKSNFEERGVGGGPDRRMGNSLEYSEDSTSPSISPHPPPYTVPLHEMPKKRLAQPGRAEPHAHIESTTDRTSTNESVGGVGRDDNRHGDRDDASGGEGSVRAECRDLLDMLLQCGEDRGEADSKLSRSELRDHLSTFLTAAHEPTSTCLLWTVYELCRHQEVQARCQREVDSIMIAGGVQQTDLGYDEINKFSYLVQVLKETMRLHPVTGNIARQCMAECTVGDYRLRKGTTVVVSTVAVHRHPSFWKDPDVFDPERFSRENIRHTVTHPYQYVPFSAGPRGCIGQRFALMEVIVVLGSLLSHFTFSLAAKDRAQVQEEETLTMQPLNLNVVVSLRETYL